ncbi:MAG: hypothetical protein IDH49_04065 [Gammaproteobacteria bacterium]|nr:hypothetical protein [Gammaproteobacteria bacterium]
MRAAEDAGSGHEVMQSFVKKERAISEHVLIAEKERRQILFIMGAVLLVSILLTAGLGISMVVYGKQVFVPHMIFAGISVFLAVAHAVTAMVWFFPF